MINYANENIQAMKSYSPPIEGRRLFKGDLLDFNERTTSPSKKVLKAIKDFVNDGKIQLYPEYKDLNKKIADYAGVQAKNVMIANGSDQAIDLIFRTFTKKDDEVIIPTPSFAMFFQCARVMENKLIMPEYKKDLSFPLDEVLQAVTPKTKLLILCNPNNPTGTPIPLQAIKTLLDKALKTKTLVFIDEAYYEFSQITAAKLIKKYSNLIITRTFSKAFGLASLRIGYAISREQNLDEMLKVHGPYDIAMPAVVAANAALDDVKSMQSYAREVMEKSKPLIEKFFKKKGIVYFPSKANFILFKPSNPDEFYRLMESKGFLTRKREGANIDATIRITIGTFSQMKKFINQLKNA